MPNLALLPVAVLLVPTKGRVRVVSEEQPLNASLLIDVTLFGIAIEVRDVQFLNALLPTDVTVLGIA
jgi:hypothetical protein